MLGLASGTVVSLVISLVPIHSDAKCQAMSHSRVFKFQAPVLKRRKGKGKDLLSIPLSVSSFPPSDLSLLPAQFIRFSPRIWALGTLGAGPDIPVKSTGLFPTNKATVRSTPILNILLLGVGMLGI